MSAPIAFFFDFSSPYAYFAAHQVDALAARHGREVDWRPILLGPAFQASGNQPLVVQPLKGDYCRHDWDRIGRATGIPWRMPDPFPIPTLAAARATWWLRETDAALSRRFALAVFRAFFGEGRDIRERDVVADIAAPLGIGRPELLAAVEDPAWKARLKAETEAAIASGVFGAPFLVVDGEPFWGWDRLPMVEDWLRRGGW